MNWKKLLGKNEVITAAERRRLEELEKACAEIEEARKEAELWPGSPGEQAQRVEALAAEYAAKPSPQALGKILETGRFPVAVKAAVLGALQAEQCRRMAPAHVIVRDIFKRAEEEGVVERARLIAREKGESEEVGVPYVAGPKVRALEERIVAFRREISVPLPAETDGPCPEPAPWRQRLADFI